MNCLIEKRKEDSEEMDALDQGQKRHQEKEEDEGTPPASEWMLFEAMIEKGTCFGVKVKEQTKILSAGAGLLYILVS